MAQMVSFFVAITFPGSWVEGSLMAHFLGHLKEKIRDYNLCQPEFPKKWGRIWDTGWAGDEKGGFDTSSLWRS